AARDGGRLRLRAENLHPGAGWTKRKGGLKPPSFNDRILKKRKAAYAAFRIKKPSFLGGLLTEGRQLLILLELAGGLQRNADVPHSACYPCFLDSELTELPTECRQCERLFLLIFTPCTVVLV